MTRRLNASVGVNSPSGVSHSDLCGSAAARCASSLRAPRITDPASWPRAIGDRHETDHTAGVGVQREQSAGAELRVIGMRAKNMTLDFVCEVHKRFYPFTGPYTSRSA
jgi:hypothetical protein